MKISSLVMAHIYSNLINFITNPVLPFCGVILITYLHWGKVWRVIKIWFNYLIVFMTIIVPLGVAGKTWILNSVSKVQGQFSNVMNKYTTTNMVEVVGLTCVVILSLIGLFVILTGPIRAIVEGFCRVINNGLTKLFEFIINSFSGIWHSKPNTTT